MRGVGIRALPGVPVSEWGTLGLSARAKRPPWVAAEGVGPGTGNGTSDTTASVNVEPGDLLLIVGVTGGTAFNAATLSNGDTVTNLLNDITLGTSKLQLGYAKHTGAAGSTTATVSITANSTLRGEVFVIRGVSMDAPILQDPSVLGVNGPTNGTLTMPAFTVAEAYAMAVGITVMNDDNTPTTTATDWTFYGTNVTTSRAFSTAFHRLQRGRTTTAYDVAQSTNGPDNQYGYRLALRAA